MFELKKFIALIGIEDGLMDLFYTMVEEKGLNPRFDIYHVLAGEETPTESELIIMNQIFEKFIKGTVYEQQYNTADADFSEKIAEKNRNRMNRK